MTVARIIEDAVNSIGPGKIFTINDLGLPNGWWDNIRVKLSRMVDKGKIQKLSKGKFYKPRKSMFGEQSPGLDELAKDFIKDGKGKTIGYLTGYSVWNNMGLTSQIPNIIVIGTNRRLNPKKRGIYYIHFLFQPNKITKGSIFLLQILDTIKLIKQIPDTDTASSIKSIKALLQNLNETQLDKIVKLSAKYPPRVKAILGAILEDLGYKEIVSNLHNSLKPGTFYKLGLTDTHVLPTKTNWNIK